MFEMLDQDNDSSIHIDEIMLMMTVCIGIEMGTDERRLSQVVQLIDTDRSGELLLNVFDYYLLNSLLDVFDYLPLELILLGTDERLVSQVIQTIDTVVQIIDTDRSGESLLNVFDYYLLNKLILLGTDERLVNQVVQIIDTDRSGELLLNVFHYCLLNSSYWELMKGL